jgi:lysophospholipase L1-like esterase
MSGRYISRRRLLGSAGTLLGAGAALGSLGSLVGCGGGDTAPITPSGGPEFDLGTPVGRLKNAIVHGQKPLPNSTIALDVTQGSINSADPAVGMDTVIYPPPAGFLVNPNPASLADISQIWGYRRDTWHQHPPVYINSLSNNASWYVPVSVLHTTATAVSNIPCPLHFEFTGQAFEILYAGRFPTVTLIADNQYAADRFINTTLDKGTRGDFLSVSNTVTRFDFGSAAKRRISLYGFSELGTCAIAMSPGDALAPWDRSEEPSFCAMVDSYGQGAGINWGLGGSFWEAAALLGIAHIDLNTMGGTGYAPAFAPNGSNREASDPGNAFGARIPDSVASAPDLFLTAGSINDNILIASPPLYATAADAKAAFDAATARYYRDLRSALPQSVLAAIGPWAPVESIPVNPVAQSKLETIRSSLQAIAGPWVFVDNLNGGWINSSGASSPPTGRGWQTGTGNVGAPKGDGNGDLYVSADGTHPTPAGNVYLGQLLATNLRAAILAL